MAVELCLAAAANAVGTLMVKPIDYLVKPIKRRVRYLFCLNKIVEELREQEKKLTEEQTRVQRKVDKAQLQPQTQVIEENVTDWLTKAKNILIDVQSLNNRIQENKRCFRWCPHWSWQYQLGKDVEQKTKAIIELVQSSDFEIIGHPTPLPGIEWFLPKDLIYSTSSISAFNQIMDALTDDGVNIIRVWGIGGVGKTTLVKGVRNKVKELGLFDQIVFVAVSQTPVIGEIQKKIADSIGLEFTSTITELKAEELWCRLNTNKEKILIIFDDVWEKLELENIGIPLAKNREGCKIILTTRHKKVLVSVASQGAVSDVSIESQVTISLDVLDEVKAWTLFKRKANLDEKQDDARIIKVAKEVASECKGLPVAIVALASALRDTKPVRRWEIALKKLRASRLMEIGNIEEQEKNAYVCLKMSYDYLKDTRKRCFLLCALFPEDHSIDVEDELVRYAWGLELYRDATSIEEVRYEVEEAIDHLKDSCLLLDDGERYIKVHDVVRDFALWIASKENNGLVAKQEGPSENKNCEEKLEILLLEDYVSQTQIESLERMRALKVLSLTVEYNSGRRTLFSLNALKSLTNLRALQLITSTTKFQDVRMHNLFVQLEGISIFENLTSLEILSLHGFMLKESMDMLGILKNLRVLDIHSCEFSSIFLSNLIQSLEQIEELYLDYLHKSICTHVLGKLSSLSSLTSLWLDLSSPCLPEGFAFPSNLERYTIDMREWLPYHKRITPSRSLRISKGLPLNVFQELLPNVEFLQVDSIEVKEIKCLTDTTPGNVSVATVLQDLNHLKISSCPNLKVIFQMEKAENLKVVLSKLKYLQLKELPDLECLWKMPAQHVRLGCIETIELHECGKLKSLFTFSLSQSLDHLEKLVVNSCGQLKQIVDDLGGDGQRISPNMNLCLPKLRTLNIKECDSLEYIFPNLMAPQGLPQLQKLRMEHLPQLKQIRKATNELLSQRQHFLFLTELTVSHCPELKDVTVHLKPTKIHLQGIQVSNLKELVSFTNTKELSLSLKEISDYNLILEAAQERLNQLTSFEIFECNSLEYLVDATKKHVPNTAFTNLVALSMRELGGLKAMCNGQIPNGFLQNLKRLSVKRCGKLEEVFQIDERKQNQPQVLSNLELLVLSELSELRWIFKGPAQCFNLQSLKKVDIYGCGKLKSLFPPFLIQSLRQLEELTVENCEELKTLFAEQENDGETESNCNLDSLCLPRLTYLRIYGCGSLQYVLPITLAQGLTHLKQSAVSKCPRLKQVFGVEGEDNGPENYSVKAPVLKDLSVHECPQLMKFSIQEVNNDIQIRLKEVPLFAFEELGEAKNLDLRRMLDQENLISGVNVEGEKCKDLEYLVDTTRENMPTSALLTKVVKLYLWEMNGLKMLCNGHPPKGFLQDLQLLLVEKCPKIVFLYPLVEKLSVLTVKECEKLEEVFRIDDFLYDSREENQARLLSKLDYLHLASLPELRRIVKGPTHYVCLGNLLYVRIKKCNKLKSLFTFSLIPSLTLLETLLIDECDELETVFGALESDDETESNLQLATAQEFPHLQRLSLRKLGNLKSFGPQNHSIKAPALTDLTVGDCPKLSSFSIQQDKSLQTKETEACIGDGESCNNQLRERSPNLAYPIVNNFEQLFLLPFGYMCKAPTQVVISNLIRELYILDLERLMHIFTLLVVQNLPNLSVVEISRCKNLARIIVNDDMSASSSSSQGHDQDETGVKNDKEKLRFSQLNELKLQDLSSLSSFSPVGCHLVFPSLDSLTITGCPRLIASFTVDSTLCVHAQTKAIKAPRLKEEETILEGSAKTEETHTSRRDICWKRLPKFSEEITILPPYKEEIEAISPV